MLNKDYSAVRDNDGFLYMGWQYFKPGIISMCFAHEQIEESAVLNIPADKFNNLVSVAQNSGFKATVNFMFTILGNARDRETLGLMFDNYKNLPAHLFREPFTTEYADKLTKMAAKSYYSDEISLTEFRKQADAIQETTLQKQSEAPRTIK